MKYDVTIIGCVPGAMVYHPRSLKKAAGEAGQLFTLNIRRRYFPPSLYLLKLLAPEAHREYTGVSNLGILRNLEELMESGRAVTVRIPLIPHINDTADEVERFARYLGRFRGCRVELLPYHYIGAAKYARLGRTYRLPDTPQPTATALERIGEAFTQAGLRVTIGG